MSDSYVVVERHFRDAATPQLTSWSRRHLRESVGDGWEALVPASVAEDAPERTVLVILAPSGAGKTTEVRRRAVLLREAGVPVFLLSAAKLARDGTARATDAVQQLNAWRESSERAVFFLDGVDEARLEGDDLEHVVRRLAQDIDPATKRLQLVITSRNDLWRQDDLRHLVGAMSLDAKAPGPRVVRLEALGSDDVVAFARARGVADPDSVGRAFLEDELDMLLEQLRPPDVEVLVDYWKKHGAFGSWSEMIEVWVESGLREENRLRAQGQLFTLDEARSALRRLGAATVLGKRPLVALPGSSRPQEIDSQRLFDHWTLPKLAQLLSMGVFTQKGLDSVQLPQGAVSHFLAASWLADRARGGWEVDELERELLVRPFGIDRTFVPLSRAPVVGWIAGHVPTLRSRLLRELPHVLLFEGDPARLSRSEIVQSLRALLAAMKTDGRDVAPTRGTVRKIAQHDIGNSVAALLGDYGGTPLAERLLLRIAEVGRFGTVTTAALALALTPTTEREVVEAAIRVVAATGTVAQRNRLLALSEHPSEWVRLALVQALAPEVLSGSTLVQLVLQVTDSHVAYLLGHALTKAALVDIDSILSALQPHLSSSTTDERTKGRLELASRLVVARLVRGGDSFPGWLASLLLAIESHMAGPLHVSGDVTDSLESLLRANVALRRALWQARISPRRAGGLGRVFHPRLGRALAGDVEWLWQLRAASADEQVRFALESPLRDAYRGMDATGRNELLTSSTVASDIRVFVEQMESAQASFESTRREAEAKEAEENATVRARNIAEVTAQRTQIAAGENASALSWAWPHLTDAERRAGRIGTGRLVELVGAELAEVFVSGFQRWWRRTEPRLRQPGDGTVTFDALAGLTGLSLEVERGLDLATLSDEEVDRAFRYALFELNGFPPWFDALRAAHPTSVRKLLAIIIQAEWTTTSEHHGVIARAPYEAEGTSQLIRDLVVEMLEGGAPGNARTVHYAIGALLLPNRLHREIASTLKRHVETAAAADVVVLAEWVRGWAHFAPRPAAHWLRALARSDRSRFLALVEQAAALLEEDLGEHGRRSATAPWEPAALEAWVRVLHLAVRPEDDIPRAGTGVYHPGPRDRAQQFRNRCVSLLAGNPSRAAFEALRRIRTSREMKQYAEFASRLVDAQLSAAAEDLARPWSESDILTVERGDERPPSTTADLLALVRRHLRRVADLLENSDFSYAKLFGEGTDEAEVQCWIASCLTLVSRGLYTVEREPEVQDDRVMDISVTVPGIGRVPIEIKPLYKRRYPYAQLERFVSDQLVGCYMRPPSVERGIFLMVPLVSRTWRVDGRTLSFDEVFAKLSAHAVAVGTKKLKEVVVASINVARARAPRRGKKKRAARKVTIAIETPSTGKRRGAPGKRSRRRTSAKR